jgi:hypothetical protein
MKQRCFIRNAKIKVASLTTSHNVPLFEIGSMVALTPHDNPPLATSQVMIGHTSIEMSMRDRQSHNLLGHSETDRPD